MYTVTVWNKTSTNFDANAFVNANGTDRVEVESRREALYLMVTLIHASIIDRAILEGPEGLLTWQQHHTPTIHPPDEPCDCYGCVHGEPCCCDESDTCDGDCGCQDDEDDDPRR